MKSTLLIASGWALSSLAIGLALGRFLGFTTYLLIGMTIPNMVFHAFFRARTQDGRPFRHYALFLAALLALLMVAALGIEEVRLLWRWAEPGRNALLVLLMFGQLWAVELLINREREQTR